MDNLKVSLYPLDSSLVFPLQLKDSFQLFLVKSGFLFMLKDELISSN